MSEFGAGSPADHPPPVSELPPSDVDSLLTPAVETEDEAAAEEEHGPASETAVEPELVPTVAPIQLSAARRIRRRVRRSLRRWKKKLAKRRRPVSRATVRLPTWDTVEIARPSWARARRYRLDDPAARCVISARTLTIAVPDAAALARLAASCVLRGRMYHLELRLAASPAWLLAGVQPPRLQFSTEEFSWRRRGDGVELRLGWAKREDIHRALSDAVAAVLRARSWDQASGPVYTLDRLAWLDGTSSWPQGHLAAEPPPAEQDELGRPLGPYLVPEKRVGLTTSPPLITAVANPHGRRLIGAATPYRLVPDSGRLLLSGEGGRTKLHLDPANGPECVALDGRVPKYAVVRIDSSVTDDDFAAHVLRTLAACGLVFAAAGPAIRAELDALRLVTVSDPAEVAGLRGYALSVEAARRMAIAGDAALRRTVLGGDGAVPLPTVTAIVASMRPDHIDTCLGYLANQTYPALEVVVGLHGYDVPADTRDRWLALLPFPTRVVSFPAEITLGMVLGRLSRIAEGELITKVDDDDHYGANHVTDLVLAWHTTGADLVAKGARFVHFRDLGETIDRAWAAPEVFNMFPAGGTMLLSRSSLQRIGGWSHSSKHVDADLIKRVRYNGGLTYRTHALEYVYVRRGGGHTWVARIEELIEQGEQVYHGGLPTEILQPRYSAG
jgi:hypothetical protein